MQYVRTCNCGEHSYSLDEILKRVKDNPRQVVDELENKVIGWLFECDCGSTLMIKIDVVNIDVLDLI